ncbi:MAG: hypothetical protein ACOZBZ_02710 [Patescibacteria group bacterium]
MIISPLSVKKIKETIIPDLVEEYYPLFRAERKDVSRKDLFSLANSAFENAIISFRKSKSPKICDSLSTYTLYWLREEFNNFFQIKTLKKVSLQKTDGEQDQYSKAIRDFSSILPLELLTTQERQLFGAKPFEKRKKIYRQYRLTLDRLKKPFKNMVESRNVIAKKKGYPDYVSFIKDECRIPNEEFNRFLVNVDQVIYYFYSNLPKVKDLPEWFYDRLNKPCLLCLVPFKGLAVPEEVLNFVKKMYPQLKLFLPKIRLLYKERAYTRYIKENDVFEVVIDKSVNQRHQMVSLVHEFGHIIYFLDSFARNEDLIKHGKYAAEKAAIKIQLKVLSAIDPNIMKAYDMDLLLVMHRTLFELAVYKKPKQNYDLLYTRLFNKCFPDASQRRNPLYLLDEAIVARPLSSLLFTVASVNIILESKSK